MAPASRLQLASRVGGRQPPRSDTTQAFRAQAKLAVELGKALVVHARLVTAQNEDLCFETLSELVPVDHPVHIHCYSDSLRHALQLCERWPNLRIGFTGAITFRDRRDKGAQKGKGGVQEKKGEAHLGVRLCGVAPGGPLSGLTLGVSRGLAQADLAPLCMDWANIGPDGMVRRAGSRCGTPRRLGPRTSEFEKPHQMWKSQTCRKDDNIGHHSSSRSSPRQVFLLNSGPNEVCPLPGLLQTPPTRRCSKAHCRELVAILPPWPLIAARRLRNYCGIGPGLSPQAVSRSRSGWPIFYRIVVARFLLGAELWSLGRRAHDLDEAAEVR